jgi:hypothetical protein
MREINEIIEYLQREVQSLKFTKGAEHIIVELVQDQLDNANKVKAKLQGAIDLFKEIEEL